MINIFMLQMIKINDEEFNVEQQLDSSTCDHVKCPSSDLNIYTVVLYTICCLVGLPVNVLIAVRTIRKSSHPNTDNIFLLSTIFSSIFTLVETVVEVALYFWPGSNKYVCLFVFSNVDLPFALFSFNLFLALIDRYVSVTYPSRRHQQAEVNVHRVIVWLCILNVALVLPIEWVYIGLIADCANNEENNNNLHCGGVFQHMTLTLAVVVVILHLSSIVILVVVYCKAKSRLQSSAGEVMMNETIQFLVNIIPLLVVSLPLVLFDCYYFVCSHLSGINVFDDERIDAECNRWLAPYAGISILILSVLHPINNLRMNDDSQL